MFILRELGERGILNQELGEHYTLVSRYRDGNDFSFLMEKTNKVKESSRDKVNLFVVDSSGREYPIFNDITCYVMTDKGRTFESFKPIDEYVTPIIMKGVPFSETIDPTTCGADAIAPL